MTVDPAVQLLAQEIDRLKRQMRTMARAAQGPRRSVDITVGGTSYYAEDGTPLLQIGQGEDGEFGVINVDPTTPPVPTSPDLFPTIGGIRIIWDGTFVDANWPTNMSHVEVHVSATPDFEATDATQVAVFSSRHGGEYIYAVTDTDLKYVALVAVTQANVESAKSAEVSESGDLVDTATADAIDALQTATEENAAAIVVAQASADSKNTVTYSNVDPAGAGSVPGDTWFKFASAIIVGQWGWDGSSWVPQTIGNAVIANLDAGKITSGFISAARIDAASITGEKLAADAIDGKVITGAYIRTAETGKRWELDASVQNRLRAYSGDASETFPGELTIDVDGGGVPYVALSGPHVSGDTGQSSDLYMSGTYTQLSGEQVSIKGTFIDETDNNPWHVGSVTASADTNNGYVDLDATDVDGSGTSVNLHVGGIGGSARGVSISLDTTDSLSDNFYFDDVDGLDVQTRKNMKLQAGGALVIGGTKVGSTPAGGPVNGPFLSRTHQAGTSIANQTFTNLAFATQEVTDSKITSSAGTHTIVVPGLYRINASVGFVFNGTGRRICGILHNGVEVARDERNANDSTTTTPPTIASCSRTIQAAAGDTIVVRCWQNSGGSLALSTSKIYNYLDITWLGWGNVFPA